MAAGTVDVPVAGKVKKEWLIYGGVAVASLVAYRWFTASRSDDGPIFGEGYDEFGNLLGSDPMMVSPGSSAGLTDKTPTTEPFAFNNNAEWTQWVVDYLSDSSVPRESALGAVGDYLARRPLSPKEQEWIRGAIAAGGPPPQGGPFDVIPETPGTVPPPSAPLGRVATPSVTSAKPTAVTFKWAAVPGADRYYVSRVGGGQTSHSAADRSHTSRSLRRNTSYTFRIRAARGTRPNEIVGDVTQFTVRTAK